MGRRKPLRRAGSRWRLLVHEWLGRGAETKYGVAHHVTGREGFGGHVGNSEWSRTHVLPNTEFDELVVGSWLHVEQMDTGTWWMSVGGVTLWVKADRDGQPLRVDVYGPRDYAAPVDGCKYQVTWTEEPGDG